MRPELDNKLFEKYPILYQSKDKPPTESLMCFGFECLSGWYKIIDELSQKIEEHNKNAEHPTIAIQVKEKYGSLRFYVTSATDYIYDLIDKAEEKSYEVCENCGSEEDVKTEGSGWITTLCKECKELPSEEMRKREFSL